MTSSDRYYAAQADKEEGRDHDVRVAYANRLTLSEGAFGRAWMRFNPGVTLIYVDDMEGRPRALTPKQYAVLTYVMDALARNVNPGTMRDVAKRLEFAPSTVSRALCKLAAWGLIAYVCGRGRLAGLVIFRRVKDDGLDRFRKAAKDRVRRWSEAASERVSRLWANVAPYYLGGMGNDIGRDEYLGTSKGATLTPWSRDEVLEALGEM